MRNRVDAPGVFLLFYFFVLFQLNFVREHRGTTANHDFQAQLFLQLIEGATFVIVQIVGNLHRNCGLNSADMTLGRHGVNLAEQ